MVANKNLAEESERVLKQLEESIAECVQLKKENEKLRKDINAVVMYTIQNKHLNTGQEIGLDKV